MITSSPNQPDHEMPAAIVTTEERHNLIATALEGVSEGKSLSEIANETGIKPKTLNAWLLSDVPEKYRPVQQQGLISRIVDADEILEDAPNHLAVARAREMCRFRRWDAERRLPTLFAPRQEITGPGGGPIVVDSLERARRYAFLRSHVERDPIDVEPVAVQHEKQALTELSTE
jgi:hypothetical protein